MGELGLDASYCYRDQLLGGETAQPAVHLRATTRREGVEDGSDPGAHGQRLLPVLQEHLPQHRRWSVSSKYNKCVQLFLQTVPVV